MKLSTKSRYGLRILLQISLDNESGDLSRGRSIAEKQEISEPYLEQIMIPLKNGGIIRTVRGCRGGYHLNRRPEEITLLDVLELFEGKMSLVDCRENKCRRLEQCPIKEVWEDLSATLRRHAKTLTLADIVEKYRLESKYDYVI